MNSSAAEFFTRRSVLFASAILCTLLWGSAYPAIKNGYALLNISPDDVPSQMVFAGYRFLLAGIFLLLLARATGRPWWGMKEGQLGKVTVLGLTQTTLQYIFFYIGLAFATGVKASIVNATGTFFSVLLAHFIYRNERLSYRKSIGCLTGFAGVMVVNFSDSLLTLDFTLAGEGAVMFAAFILAAASIYGKTISQTMDAMLMTAWQLAIGGAALLAIGFAFGGKSGDFTLTSFSLLVYLALLSSIAFALWSILLKFNPVGMVTIFNFLIPIFGAGLSALFLNESIMEWKNLIALVLVCGGIYLVTKAPVR
ncbi:MAG: DMT family transporter [Cellvibrio sp.]|jgi:drug/metabolite transporter (DMT)-like permease